MMERSNKKFLYIIPYDFGKKKKGILNDKQNNTFIISKYVTSLK